jgi:putative ABC transport system substrate-binding protein
MRRRDFITLLAGTVLPWQRVARAQTPARMRRIGVLIGLQKGDPEGQRWVTTFTDTLRELGWRDGANVQIDIRWSGDVEEMRTYAQELADLKPDVIQVATALATAEVLRITRTIPVVFSVVNDPVAIGFVQSLPRPGGNATGFMNIEPTLGKKWLELLKEIAPRVTRATMVFNPVPGSQFEQHLPQLEAAAAPLGITIKAAPARNITEIDRTIGAIKSDPQDGLIVIPDPFFNLARSDFVSSLVAHHRIVAIYPVRDFVVAGGLISLSVDVPDLQRRAAGYVDRILKGAAPADLPVEAPIKFELVVNRKAAKALGITIPPAVLARASEIID